jgi:hypothetical protein
VDTLPFSVRAGKTLEWIILPLNHGLWPCDPKSFGAIRRVQGHER